jgi:hypothetical protein
LISDREKFADQIKALERNQKAGAKQASSLGRNALRKLRRQERRAARVASEGLGHRTRDAPG